MLYLTVYAVILLLHGKLKSDNDFYWHPMIVDKT